MFCLIWEGVAGMSVRSLVTVKSAILCCGIGCLIDFCSRDADGIEPVQTLNLKANGTGSETSWTESKIVF